MFDDFDRVFRLTDSEASVLSRDPRYQQRVRALALVSGAFLAAPILYIFISEMGVIKPSPGITGLWPVLVLMSVAHVPVMMVVVRQLLAQAAGVRNFEEASARASQLMVTSLAFGEAVTIYGFISPMLGADRQVRYSLMVAGLVFLAITLKILWPRAVRMMLVGLAREKAAQGPR